MFCSLIWKLRFSFSFSSGLFYPPKTCFIISARIWPSDNSLISLIFRSNYYFSHLRTILKAWFYSLGGEEEIFKPTWSIWWFTILIFSYGKIALLDELFFKYGFWLFTEKMSFESKAIFNWFCELVFDFSMDSRKSTLILTYFFYYVADLYNSPVLFLDSPEVFIFFKGDFFYPSSKDVFFFLVLLFFKRVVDWGFESFLDVDIFKNVYNGLYLNKIIKPSGILIK